MKVSELTGELLDYWVARAEGFEPAPKDQWTEPLTPLPTGTLYDSPCGSNAPRYSCDWEWGGPLIDKYRVTFATTGTGPRGENGFEPVVAIAYDGGHAMTAPTHLIAMCRAIVRDRFGKEVPDAI